MPNLKTDRTAGVAQGFAALNVRRLMYQLLIWTVDLGHHARRLRAALNAEHLQGASDSLVDGMGGDAELDGYLFGGQMLVDEQQAVELPLAQLCDALGNKGVAVAGWRSLACAIIVMAAC